MTTRLLYPLPFDARYPSKGWLCQYLPPATPRVESASIEVLYKRGFHSVNLHLSRTPFPVSSNAVHFPCLLQLTHNLWIPELSLHPLRHPSITMEGPTTASPRPSSLPATIASTNVSRAARIRNSRDNMCLNAYLLLHDYIGTADLGRGRWGRNCTWELSRGRFGQGRFVWPADGARTYD